METICDWCDGVGCEECLNPSVKQQSAAESAAAAVCTDDLQDDSYVEDYDASTPGGSAQAVVDEEVSMHTRDIVNCDLEEIRLLRRFVVLPPNFHSGRVVIRAC